MRCALLLGLALAAGAAQAQEDAAPQWRSAVDKADAWMNYGVPEAEETELVLSCTRGTGQIKILFPVQHRPPSTIRGSTWVDDVGRPAPWPTSVTVASGAASTTVRGQADVDELSGGSTITVELSEKAPVMQAFAKSGELRLIAMGETVAHPPAPRRDAARFVRSCR